jgi:hypothetical protein
MGLILAFFCGIANFAMHKAVVESGHPLLAQVPWLFYAQGGRFGLGIEFIMLLGAMLMIAGGSTGWALGYGVYSLVNAASAWLILSRRI